jgi:hypothetical protein
MATAAVTNTFVNGQTADADDVNTNFANLVSFLNSSVVHADGAVTMSGALDMGGFGFKNVGNHLRSYSVATSTTRSVSTDATFFDWESAQVTITDPGVPVRVLAWAFVRFEPASASSVDVRTRLVIGGAASTIARHVSTTTEARQLSVLHHREFDPTGNFVVGVEVWKNGTPNVDFAVASIGVLVIPQ